MTKAVIEPDQELGGRQSAFQAWQGQRISFDTKPRDRTSTGSRDFGDIPARCRIGDVNFNRWKSDSPDSGNKCGVPTRKTIRIDDCTADANDPKRTFPQEKRWRRPALE
jgi:hypothetical protein